MAAIIVTITSTTGIVGNIFHRMYKNKVRKGIAVPSPKHRFWNEDVSDNIYNNCIHHAYAYRMFWLFQELNRHFLNLFHIAYSNHPIDY